MHLPFGGKELVDRVRGEEIRCPMGAVEHADLPNQTTLNSLGELAKSGLQQPGQAASKGFSLYLCGQRQYIANPQGATGMTAKLTQGEGGSAAQIDRQIQPTADRHIAATTLGHLAQHQQLPGLDGNSTVIGHRLAIQSGGRRGSGQRNHGIGMKTQAGTENGALKACCIGTIAHQAIAQTEGSVIHGARRRYPDIPITDTTWIILHRGIGTGDNHLHRRGQEGDAVERLSGHITGQEAIPTADLTQIIQVGGDTAKTGLIQRLLQSFDGLDAILSIHDQLGQHGIIVGGNLGALLYPAIHPQIRPLGREYHLG